MYAIYNIYAPYSTKITPTLNCMLHVQSSYRWDGLNIENSTFASKLRPLMKKLSLFCFASEACQLLKYNEYINSIYTKYYSPIQSDVAVTTIDDIKNTGRLLPLALMDKYSDTHFIGAMTVPHVRQMRQEFLQKRLHKAREHEQTWCVCGVGCVHGVGV